jgi:hypothetical protein
VFDLDAMSIDQMILIRRIATPVGIALFLIGMALLDPVLALSVYAVIGLLLGGTYLRARRRSRSSPRPTRAEQVEAANRFIHTQRRWDIFQAIFVVYIVGALYWIEGLGAPIVLVALGGAVLSAERLLVEPRIWAALSRQEGFGLS